MRFTTFDVFYVKMHSRSFECGSFACQKYSVLTRACLLTASRNAKLMSSSRRCCKNPTLKRWFTNCCLRVYRRALFLRVQEALRQTMAQLEITYTQKIEQSVFCWVVFGWFISCSSSPDIYVSLFVICSNCVCSPRMKDDARRNISEHSMEEARKRSTVQAQLDVALVSSQSLL